MKWITAQEQGLEQTNGCKLENIFQFRASLRTKSLLKSQKADKKLFARKNIQGLSFYYIEPLNNLFNVFQVAISFFEETILISF